jgi:transcriptional regulator with XRE-family HTH domain
LDVSVALVSQIERGACLPSLLTFVRLMDLLEVDANTLLGRESVASAEVDAS